ncbi:MAG: Nucleoid occlusion protein (plasmid) [Chroococcopsis gigantea SAG 12.99]|jgi:ParB family chromosome partitioning protein|nr:Nucleoid occlusion protein [Chroococcopsis gigantea SAG 12.99]
MAKVKFDLGKVYKPATELSSAEAEISRLQSEVEFLRKTQNQDLEAQIEALRKELSSRSAIGEIAMSSIVPNPDQPRQSISDESIELMAQSLAKDGQLQPLILMVKGEGYEIFDGERRWRGANALGWKTIKAIVMPRPEDLHRKALLTTLHREDLNPLDKATALLREITEQTGIDMAEIPRMLSTSVRRLDYQKRMKEVSDLIHLTEEEQREKLDVLGLNGSEQEILLVLLGLGLNPASVCANDFRMLSLFTDLQKAIRESHLKAAHAIVLQRLSPGKLKKIDKQAERIRIKATGQVIEEKLSLAGTKKLVDELINKHAPKDQSQVNQSSTVTILNRLKKLSLAGATKNQLVELRQELLSKLEELENQLKNNPEELV